MIHGVLKLVVRVDTDAWAQTALKSDAPGIQNRISTEDYSEKSASFKGLFAKLPKHHFNLAWLPSSSLSLAFVFPLFYSPLLLLFSSSPSFHTSSCLPHLRPTSPRRPGRTPTVPIAPSRCFNSTTNSKESFCSSLLHRSVHPHSRPSSSITTAKTIPSPLIPNPHKAHLPFLLTDPPSSSPRPALQIRRSLSSQRPIGSSSTDGLFSHRLDPALLEQCCQPSLQIRRRRQRSRASFFISTAYTHHCAAPLHRCRQIGHLLLSRRLFPTDATSPGVLHQICSSRSDLLLLRQTPSAPLCRRPSSSPPAAQGFSLHWLPPCSSTLPGAQICLLLTASPPHHLVLLLTEISAPPVACLLTQILAPPFARLLQRIYTAPPFLLFGLTAPPADLASSSAFLHNLALSTPACRLGFLPLHLLRRLSPTAVILHTEASSSTAEQ